MTNLITMQTSMVGAEGSGVVDRFCEEVNGSHVTAPRKQAGLALYETPSSPPGTARIR